MATAAAVERFKAQGKQQLNVWVDTDTAAVLKTLSVQRSQSYGDVIRDALVSLHSGQPVAPATGGDSIDRLSLSVTGLHDDIASVRSIIGDWSNAFESRLSDLQDDLEGRLQQLETLLAATPVLPIPLQQPAPESPVQPAPGGNESAGKRNYGKVSNVEIKERRERFIALHHQGLSTTGISKAIQAEGFMVGTSAGEIDKYLRSKGLIPHSSRK